MTTTKKQHRILLVDDEEKITKALGRALRSEGYEVVACNDPTRALVLLETERFDLVVSDHLMPGMTGLELTRRIRERFPDVQRVMVTGQPDVPTLVQAINHGEVCRFVLKPWDDRELKQALAAALSQLEIAREERRAGAIVRRWSTSF
jgi:two-component system NtrC family sensor kinase